MLRLIAILLLISSAFSRECDNPVISSIVLPPLVYANEQGDLDGPYIEKGKSITDRVFKNPSYTKALPINRTLIEFRQGRIDVLLFELKDKNRESYTAFTNPIGHLEWGVVTRADLELEWIGFEGLKTLKGGYMKGAPIPEYYLTNLAHYDDFSELAEEPLSILNLIILKRLDYFVGVIQPLQQHAEQAHFYELDELQFHRESFYRVPIHIAVSKASPCLAMLDKMNEAILQSQNNAANN